MKWRYRSVRRWGPLLWGMLVAVIMGAVWRAPRVPHPIPGPLFSCMYDSDVEHYLRDQPFMEMLSVRWADVVAVGESRAYVDIAPDPFRQETGLREVNFAAPIFQGGQLVMLLHGLQSMPPKKLIICLSPTDLFTKQWSLTPVPPQWVECQTLLDKTLNQAVQRTISEEMPYTSAKADIRFLGGNGAMTEPTQKAFAPFSQWVAAYPVSWTNGFAGTDEAILGEDRELRLSNLNVVANQVAELRKNGWKIACIRTPISPQVFVVEESAFPSRQFRTWCADNQLPYLDYSRLPILPFDGVHLDAKRAALFTQRLAADLKNQLGW
jgi:hypothetical protein